MPKTNPYPTAHSLETMRARDITWGEVVDIVENPEVVYGPDHRGRLICQKGKLSVVVGKDGAVVTVLLRREDQWTDEDARSRIHKELSTLNDNERKVYDLIKDNPGTTTEGISVKLGGAMAKYQVDQIVYNYLHADRKIIKADEAARPAQWHVV